MPINDYDRAHIEDIVAGHGDWFTAKLIRLIAKADPHNRNLLRMGFPEEVEAYEDWCLRGSPIGSALKAVEDWK